MAPSRSRKKVLSGLMTGEEKTTYEWVDLARAEVLLKKNVFHEPGVEGTNRKVRPHKVLARANQMLRGVFATTHQGIGITIDDEICDGQHTLLAIREAARTKPDIKVYLPVTTGLHPNAFKYVDRGTKRQLMDFLNHKGLTNANVLISIARLVHAYYEVPYENFTSWRLTPDMFDEDFLEETLAEHPLIFTAVEVVSRLNKKASLAAAGAAFVVCSELRSDVEVEAFFHRAIMREGLHSGQPEYELRERFDNQMGVNAHGAKIEQFAFWVMAFNAFAKGARIKRGGLRMQRNQAFPRVASVEASLLDQG